MSRKNRAELINELEVEIHHITDRCVRRAFLCGEDAATGESFDYRREWLRARLAYLAGCFRVDVLGFGILGNHMHLLLRNRPDLVKDMSDEQAIRAWWEISPLYRYDKKKGHLTPKRLRKLLRDTDHIANCRARLSSISWFMRYLKHPLAIEANTSDDRSGHFWEARFRSKKMESLEQLLNTMIYVDLNPIRAGMARSISDSRYTSAFDRVEAAKKRRRARKLSARNSRTKLKQLAAHERLMQTADDWLSPIHFDASMWEGAKRNPAKGTRAQAANGQVSDADPRRRPDLGILPTTEEKYLMLVDLVGRIERSGKRGKIPADVPLIVAELKLGTVENWLDSYQACAEQLSSTYRSKVNTPAEAMLVRLPLVDAKTSQLDALL